MIPISMKHPYSFKVVKTCLNDIAGVFETIKINDCKEQQKKNKYQTTTFVRIESSIKESAPRKVLR